MRSLKRISYESCGDGNRGGSKASKKEVQMRKEDKRFNEHLLEWLEEVRLAHAKSTYVKYVHMARRYIAPYFEGISLGEVTILVLRDYRDKLFELAAAGRLEDGSIRCLIMIVNSVIRDAYEKQYIPNEIHMLPGCKKRRSVVKVYSEEEQKRLETYLKAHINLSTVGIYLCLYTGLRLGEVCGLRWENINTQEGYVHVKSTVQRLSKVQTELGTEPRSELIVTAPKSFSSNRLVPVPSFLLPFLQEYRDKSRAECFFLSGDPGTPMEPRTFQYQYKRYLERAGVRYLNFHSVRHTFATRCITVGMDPKTLSEILGHSDIKITMDYYFHSSFEFKKNQIERLISIS